MVLGSWQLSRDRAVLSLSSPIKWEGEEEEDEEVEEEEAEEEETTDLNILSRKNKQICLKSESQI